MTVVPYSVMRRDVWDAFVDVSRQGSFMFKRAFIDINAERFFDCSVMVCQGLTEDDDYKETELHVGDVVAVFPANWLEEIRTVESHGALLYGGLLTREDTSQVDVLRCMQLVMKYYRNYLGARELLYKCVPYIYSSLPSDEDSYALFRAGARLERRQVASVVDQLHPFVIRNLRQQNAKSAVDCGLYIERVADGNELELERFWQIHESMSGDGSKSEHTLDELKRLMGTFGKEIRLYVVRNAERETVAGAMAFEMRQVAYVQYIACTREGREMGALDLLFRHLITERYRKMRYIDFGTSNSDGGLDLDESLVFMKEGFGGRSVCYDEYRVELREFELGDMFRINLPRDVDKVVRYCDLGRVTASFEPELGRAVKRVLESGWFLLGRENRAFSEAFADFVGVKHCVLTGNGLDALKIIFRSLKLLHGWRDGDGVLVQANTYIATVTAIRDAGLVPVLFDVDANDDIDRQQLLIDLAAEDAVGRGVTLRAIAPVHLYGRVWNMDIIGAVAEKYSLLVVEDAAQAHGAAWGGRRAGSLGVAAGWSFYPGKNLGACGDAGCITTDDAGLFEVAEMMRNYGFREKYVVDVDGVNSRMDELQAAILGVKLPRLVADNQRRREIVRMYIDGIDNPLLKLPKMPKAQDECVWHILPVLCSERDRLREYLTGNDVQTLVHYPIPVHMQRTWVGEHVPLPVTERIAREEISLPLSPVLRDEEVGRVIELCNRFV